MLRLIILMSILYEFLLYNKNILKLNVNKKVNELTLMITLALKVRFDYASNIY